MKKCNCHFCREYGDCDGDPHPDRVDARYYANGFYWWGENPPKGGRRVKICDACVDSLSEESMSRDEFVSEVFGAKP